MKIPKVTRKNPLIRKRLFGSRKGARWSCFIDALLWDTTLCLTVKLAMIKRNKMRNAEIRIVHGKPTWPIKCVSMMGKMTPPRLDPVEQMPKAAPRFLLNHSGTVLRAFECMVSLRWQYSMKVSYLAERWQMRQSHCKCPETVGSDNTWSIWTPSSSQRHAAKFHLESGDVVHRDHAIFLPRDPAASNSLGCE